MEILIDYELKKNYLFKRTYAEEIVQNIENIITRIKGNVVLAREKGINSEHIDKPIDFAKAEIIADCMEEIEKEEPRFAIDKIEVMGTDLAKLKIKITGEVLYRE